MSTFKADFSDKAQRQDFRAVATCQLGSGPRSEFKDLWAGEVDLRVSAKTDALPFAAVIWNKATDLFSVTFPPTGEHLVHRVSVHFFHDGYKPVEDSSAFLPASKVIEALPQLANRDFALSTRGTDRIIEGLTHVQLTALLKAAKTVNESRAAVAEHLRETDARLKSTLGDAFREKQAAPAPVAPVAAPVVPIAAPAAAASPAKQSKPQQPKQKRGK